MRCVPSTCLKDSCPCPQLHAAPTRLVELVKEIGRCCEDYGMTTMSTCGSGSIGRKIASTDPTLRVSWNGWRRVMCCVSSGHLTLLYCAWQGTTTKSSEKKRAWWTHKR